MHVTTLISKGTIEENILRWNENIAANAGAGAVQQYDDDEDGGSFTSVPAFVLVPVPVPVCLSPYVSCHLCLTAAPQVMLTIVKRRSAWKTSSSCLKRWRPRCHQSSSLMVLIWLLPLLIIACPFFVLCFVAFPFALACAVVFQ